jgi:hypothetical protein
MLPLTLPTLNAAERSRLLSVHQLRRRALERLYERRDAVDDLIASLERYKVVDAGRLAPCIEFSGSPKS